MEILTLKIQTGHISPEGILWQWYKSWSLQLPRSFVFEWTVAWGVLVGEVHPTPASGVIPLYSFSCHLHATEKLTLNTLDALSVCVLTACHLICCKLVTVLVSRSYILAWNFLTYFQRKAGMSFKKGSNKMRGGKLVIKRDNKETEKCIETESILLVKRYNQFSF